MKPIGIFICAFVWMGVFLSADAQTLFTYGNTNVSREEFKNAFLKNNNGQVAGEQEYRDYLDLYIRFKLKVKAAYEMRLDTLPNQKAELSDFRTQLAEGFLNDSSSFHTLVNEAFIRSQKDIFLAHIYIPLNSLYPLDTVKAWTQAMEAYNELRRGIDFGNVATRFSSDPSVKMNKGEFGYITVFTLPYNLENMAYATAPGKFSMPFRSKTGYHIFRNMGERKAAGKLKAAQILLAFPPNANDTVKAVIGQRADSVYQALLKGASFTEMVKKYSNDNAGYANRGEMPEFGVGKFHPDFEKAAFGLKTDGSISRPIRTSHGYHIVQRIKHSPVNTDAANEEAMALLKQQVQNDMRMDVSRKAMMQKIYRLTGFKKEVVNEKRLFDYADSSIRGKPLAAFPGSLNKTLLFSFPGKKVYAGDWFKHLQSFKEGDHLRGGKTFRDLLDQYTESVAVGYYRDRLEQYNPAFAAQVKEFKDGNLLFEIMQRKIWDKAAADSIGLKRYFDNNPRKYWWEPGADAIIFTASDSAIANELRSKLQTNIADWRKILSPFLGKVQADSGRFEKTQIPLPESAGITPGMLTRPVKNPMDTNQTSFVHIIKVYPARSPRTFDDARGYALSDYQSYLEAKWVEDLKKKYPVRVNEKVLSSLWN